MKKSQDKNKQHLSDADDEDDEKQMYGDGAKEMGNKPDDKSNSSSPKAKGQFEALNVSGMGDRQIEEDDIEIPVGDSSGEENLCLSEDDADGD